MEFLGTIISKIFGFDHLVIIMYVATFNIALSGIYKALSFIKDKTSSNVDNKIYDIIGKILKITLKIVDSVGYNLEHKKDEPKK